MGVNVAVKETDEFASIVAGSDDVSIENCGVAYTLVCGGVIVGVVMSAEVVFVSVNVIVLLDPTATVPKLIEVPLHPLHAS